MRTGRPKADLRLTPEDRATLTRWTSRPKTAQALALRDGDVLGMEHVKKVMDVQEDFERDLKGGLGYLDAMRSYT